MRPRRIITMSGGLGLVAVLTACGSHSSPAATQPYTPAAIQAAATPAPLTASCIMGWDMNPTGNFTTVFPVIPNDVPFDQLDAFNYSGQGAPWLSTSWDAFVATMSASEITVANPSSGAMTPTESATVVYYSQNGTELGSWGVNVNNTELMPGQSSTVEDFPPAGTFSCQVVSIST